MLRLVSDADCNGKVIRGLRRKEPGLDIVRVQEAGLRTADDPTILEWAAAEGRILLTHDENTMAPFARARVAAGQPMPGVFVVPQELPIGQAIEAILLVALCSEPHEWRDRVEFLPL
jgi:predicted nuclease of predicted toxin-antitoxin system